jgi:hypothetical protein
MSSALNLQAAQVELLAAQRATRAMRTRVAGIQIGVQIAQEISRIRAGSDRLTAATVGVLGGLAGIGADILIAQSDGTPLGETLADGVLLTGVGSLGAFVYLKKHAQERVARLKARRHLNRDRATES